MTGQAGTVSRLLTGPLKEDLSVYGSPQRYFLAVSAGDSNVLARRSLRFPLGEYHSSWLVVGAIGFEPMTSTV